MTERSAEQLISRMGPTRYVWSELVFDVTGVRAASGGPFDAQTVYTHAQPGLIIDIQPRGLFFWDTSGPQPMVFESVGDARNFGDLANGRLTSSMIVPTGDPQLRVPVMPPPPARTTAESRATMKTSPTTEPSSDDGGFVLPPPAK
jgi:hypothetical protein